jgi:hypothetical protein
VEVKGMDMNISVYEELARARKEEMQRDMQFIETYQLYSTQRKKGLWNRLINRKKH